MPSGARERAASTTAYDDEPSWSPDGARLVFERSGGTVPGDLYVVDVHDGARSGLRHSAPS